MGTYFFDTYAFFEIIKGNINYQRYSKDISIITTRLNLIELYYWLLRRKEKDEADKYYQKFSPDCVNVSDDTIKEACEFRLKNKLQNLSYIDCIGYIIAIKKRIKFLTGDMEFENINNVEYVK